MKCFKTKNPCRICLETVTNKTGLQCKGDCKKWAHFKCLKYTPGKINDIQKGYLIIRCHCAECKSDEPKEFKAKQPYNCCNSGCGSNKLAGCENVKFPINLPLPGTKTQTCSPSPSFVQVTDCNSGLICPHINSPTKPLSRQPRSRTKDANESIPLQCNKRFPWDTPSCQSSEDEIPPRHFTARNNFSSPQSAGHRSTGLTTEKSAPREFSPGKIRFPKLPLFKHAGQQSKPLESKFNKTTSPETNRQKMKRKSYSHTSLMSDDMRNVGDGLDMTHNSDTKIYKSKNEEAIVSAVDKVQVAVNKLATQMNELITQIKNQTDKNHK